MHVRTTYSCCLHKSIKWHLNNHIWSLNLNLVFKPTSFNLLLVALAQNTFILPCHSMHHIVHCIDYVLFVCRYLSPLDRRDTDDVIVDTDEDSMLSSKVPGKQNPLVHSDTILLSRPALFYCIKTTTIQLLLAAVAEPLYPLHDLSFHSN